MQRCIELWTVVVTLIEFRHLKLYTNADGSGQDWAEEGKIAKKSSSRSLVHIRGMGTYVHPAENKQKCIYIHT
jgi:hypothetical protein